MTQPDLPPLPAEPPHWHLTRIEGAAQLASTAPCPDCHCPPTAAARRPDSDLPLTVTLEHDPTCPRMVDHDRAPAVETRVPPRRRRGSRGRRSS